MRRRLLRSIIAVTALALVLFGVPLGVVTARLTRNREMSRLVREATLAAGSLPGTGLHSAATSSPTKSPRMRLGLYDDAGFRVAGEGPMHGDGVVAAALKGHRGVDRDGPWLRVAVPVHDDYVTVGAARAALPRDVVDDAVLRSWLFMSALGAAAIALAGAVAAWQSSRLVAPVRAVTDRAATLGNGDFTSRLPPAGVPELDQAAEALNQTAARLADLLARERAFAADVSHQLNTPLTSLRLALESALVTPDADLGASIEEAVSEVERLQNTVATLLALAHDEDSADDTCDVATACTVVTQRFIRPLAAKGRPLRVDLDPALPPVRCSAEVVREILAVLVDNADLHGLGVVTVSARRVGTGVVLDVEDEGPGIRGDATEVFRRRSATAARNGIGLALARSLAEAHGARLELTRPTSGPVFSVALPGIVPPADN